MSVIKELCLLVVTLPIVLPASVRKTDSAKRFLFFDTVYNTYGQLLTGSALYDHCNLCHKCFCELTGCSLFAGYCPLTESQIDCTVRHDVDGGWSAWGEWGKCVGACGLVGVRERERTCSNPAPARCGEPCDDTFTTSKACYFNSVDIDEKTNKSCQSQIVHASTRASVQLSTHSVTIQPPESTSQTTESTTKSPSTTPQPMETTTQQPGVTAGVTTPAVPTVANCNKICTVSALSVNSSVEHTAAIACPNGNKQSSAALPLHCCHMGNTVTVWKPGVNVMSNCDNIPIFSAVAAFSRGHYLMGSAGVFTGCLYDGEIGFQMIRQDCGLSPNIVHVTTTDQTTFYNPDEFYLITA